MGFSLDFSPSAGHSTRERTHGRLLALPAVFWLIFFFLVPVMIVVVISFMTRGENNTIVFPLTLDQYQRIFGPIYFPVFVKSVWIALLSTVVCLLAGYPLAFFVSTRKSKRAQNIALFLVILPFWTNFLVRTYAWRVLLGTDGTINGVLMNLGIISQPIPMLFTRFAVIIGLVYGDLPFMILPIYSSIERFDFRLVEAAHDLGANDRKAFLRVILPLTMPGVIAGCILVFIPAIGAFITPDLLGGTQGLMIGNLINEQFHGTGNWPLGSAASVVMMGMVMLGLLVYIRLGRRA